MKGLLILLLAAPVSASPYFRPINLTRPAQSVGAYVDVQDAGNTSFGTAVALITHDTDDGCAFPAIACVDWTPFAIGVSANSGRMLFGMGPSANLSPIVQSLMSKALGATTGADSLLGLKALLAPGDKDFISFGPAWVVVPSQGWKGYFRVFAGAAWSFGG
jgi:hypothetical protein